MVREPGPKRPDRKYFPKPRFTFWFSLFS
jgi:hypothetical protein